MILINLDFLIEKMWSFSLYKVLMINPYPHHAATLETDFMQLDWQLLEH